MNARLQAAIDTAIAKDPKYHRKGLLELAMESEAQPRRNKYNISIPEERTCDNIVFDSKHEMEWYITYKNEERTGQIKDLTLQPAFELHEEFIDINSGEIIRPSYYIADFGFIEDGQQWVVDAKGFRTDIYLLKRKFFLYKYRHLRFKEV